MNNFETRLYGRGQRLRRAGLNQAVFGTLLWAAETQSHDCPVEAEPDRDVNVLHTCGAVNSAAVTPHSAPQRTSHDLDSTLTESWRKWLPAS